MIRDDLIDLINKSFSHTGLPGPMNHAQFVSSILGLQGGPGTRSRVSLRVGATAFPIAGASVPVHPATSTSPAGRGVPIPVFDGRSSLLAPSGGFKLRGSRSVRDDIQESPPSRRPRPRHGLSPAPPAPSASLLSENLADEGRGVKRAREERSDSPTASNLVKRVRQRERRDTEKRRERRREEERERVALNAALSAEAEEGKQGRPPTSLVPSELPSEFPSMVPSLLLSLHPARNPAPAWPGPTPSPAPRLLSRLDPPPTRPTPLPALALGADEEALKDLFASATVAQQAAVDRLVAENGYLRRRVRDLTSYLQQDGADLHSFI